MALLFDVVFHHGGEFVRDKRVFYRGGVQTIVSGLEGNNWGVNDIENTVASWGYEKKKFRVWGQHPDVFDEFFQVNEDHIAEEISGYSIGNKVHGHIYVEHNVLDITVKADQPRCLDLDAGYNEEVEMFSSDDDGGKAVRFDDSEDERTTALEDGFEVFEVEAPANGTNIVTVNNKPLRMKKCGSKTPKKKKSPKKKITSVRLNVVAPKSLVLVDGNGKGKNVVEEEIDGDYLSEELGSSDPDDSDDGTIKYEQFRKEQLNKDFKFKLGMEFKSLADFKEAIIEWNVLNGYQIKMPKNEGYRVRVLCREECGYKALCSVVGDRRTYQIKTYCGDHTCGKVLDNKSANSRWVATKVVPKMQVSKSMTVKEVFDEMSLTYGVGITMDRAWRARKIAKKIIEGDADKQYSKIWRYAAELKRACKGNSVKINVDGPSATIQPRFGSFYFCFEGCKKGFITACRPFVGVDGCHLKTRYGGQLLIAVGRDPNDQYFPLAFGVVETECKESWSWFMQLLMEDIGQDKRYVFISDQQKVTCIYY